MVDMKGDGSYLVCPNRMCTIKFYKGDKKVDEKMPQVPIGTDS